jgi:hypothetical protein
MLLTGNVTCKQRRVNATWPTSRTTTGDTRADLGGTLRELLGKPVQIPAAYG